jgi:hypothetical protein
MKINYFWSLSSEVGYYQSIQAKQGHLTYQLKITTQLQVPFDSLQTPLFTQIPQPTNKLSQQAYTWRSVTLSEKAK